MKVNDVLENAAMEIVSSLPATVAVGRMLLLTTNSKMYVGNASKKPVVMGHAVGEIRTSMLTLAQFQAEFDDTWVLANGATAAGTDYNTITSESNIPDLRGRFLRGKNNGRSDGNQDPNGDLSLGSHRSDSTKAPAGFSLSQSSTGGHSHNYDRPDTTATGAGSSGTPTNYGHTSTATSSVGDHNHSVSISGWDGETSPEYTVVNYFIKINR
ncbi:MAG: hypothetical protein U9O94_02710 [Nanoarchaeota archaeon]|nr:hypothetical protein [Nanoarchaeota archaeon]